MSKIKTPIHIEIQAFFRSRKNFYQLLHWLFLVPIDEKVFFEIQKNGNLKELAEIHEGGRILQKFFEHLSNDQIKKEQEEYQRLFIGPGPLVAPPWESYYRSKEQLLFEECTYQIRERYHDFGLQFRKENNEPDDHLLLELEFLIYLSQLSMEEKNLHRIDELLSSQIQLMEEHLNIWIPYFSERVIEHTNSQLYLGAAMLLEDFLSFDLNSLYEVREALAYV